MDDKIITCADKIFRLARWVRGSSGSDEIDFAGRVYIALYHESGRVVSKPMPDPPDAMISRGTVIKCIHELCDTGAVSAVLSIGDSLIAADATADEAAMIESLVSLGVDPPLIAEELKCAHYVLSAVLYTGDGIQMTYNSPVESCSVFRRLLEHCKVKADIRDEIRAMSNKDDPFSEKIGDFRVLWWRCAPAFGADSPSKTMLKLAQEFTVKAWDDSEIEWN